MSACCRLCESMDQPEARDDIPTTDQILSRYAPNLKDPRATGRDFQHAVVTFNAWLDREIAHAVAVEREAIAGWLTSPASDDAWADMSDTGMADAIRNGAHNEKPATSSP